VFIMSEDGLRVMNVGIGYLRRLRTRRGRTTVGVGGLVVLLASGAATFGQRVIYVHGAAAGTNTGATWEDAYADLQDALDDVRTEGGCPCEIWVAAGVYKPDRGSGDRTLAFELLDDVSIYGGFAVGEECLDDRDPTAHETVLSGDLAGNDDFAEPPTSTCCISTLQPGCDNRECADKIIALVPYCAPRWHFDCPTYAQTVCCDLCRPTRCDNSLNVFRAYNIEKAAGLDGVTVAGAEGNGPIPPYFDGGGLGTDNASLWIEGCVFRDNAALNGTAAYFRQSKTRIVNSTFSENQSYSRGTAAVVDHEGYVTVSDCAFLHNRGGSLSLEGFDPLIERSSFIGNDSIGPHVAGISLFHLGSADITDCTFVRNVGVALSNNGFARLNGCEFIGNRYGSAAGSCGGLVAINSVFVGNRAEGGGFDPDHPPLLGFAGAFSNECGSAAFLNCTFVGNHAGHIGAVWGGSAVGLTNCILWGNSDDYSGFGELAQVNTYQQNPPQINYSILQGRTGAFGGPGNSGNDPLLIDPDGPDNVLGTEDDNVRLSPGSPAINTGRPTTAELPPTDLDGHSRVLCDRVDIGAYEFGIGDYDCDQTVDLLDFSAWPSCVTGPQSGPYAVGCESFDFNADSDVDLRDFYLCSTSSHRKHRSVTAGR